MNVDWLIAAARSRTVRWIGFAASAAALLFFLVAIARTLSSYDGQRLLLDHWSAALTALVLYCFGYVAMTAAWTILARACGARASGACLARVFLVSQIGKYLPGNVAQFIGRAWAGQSRGIPLKVSAAAMALEVSGVLAAGAALAATALGSGLIAPSASRYQELAVPLAVAISSIGAMAGSIIAFHGRDMQGRQQQIVIPFVRATGCYLVVLGLMAGANIILVSAISSDWDWSLAGAVAGAFVVSWLVGYVTPGSPAGLGLRELTFFSILAGACPKEVVVLAAAAFRMATVTGDLLAWAVGMLLGPLSSPLRMADHQGR